jgi:hypothetical protein
MAKSTPETTACWAHLVWRILRVVATRRERARRGLRQFSRAGWEMDARRGRGDDPPLWTRKEDSPCARPLWP